MPAADRKALRDVLFPAQMALGWCFPSALMQYAVPDLENLSIDRAALVRRRDRFMTALAAGRYDVLPPEGTFYLWSKWPNGDPERTNDRSKAAHSDPMESDPLATHHLPAKF